MESNKGLGARKDPRPRLSWVELTAFALLGLAPLLLGLVGLNHDFSGI
jgi:hypothetical protein